MLFTERYRSELIGAIEAMDLREIESAIQWLSEARMLGRQIFVFGNGGSASTASHFVCDMVKGASCGRSSRFRMMALTESMATITAYSNDVSYETVFVEQLKNFANSGDVVVAISGSGNSANVLRAVEYADSIGCRTIALSGGNGGELVGIAGITIRVPESHMGRIEDAHMMVCHIIAYYFMDAKGSLQATDLRCRDVLSL